MLSTFPDLVIEPIPLAIDFFNPTTTKGTQTMLAHDGFTKKACEKRDLRSALTFTVYLSGNRLQALVRRDSGRPLIAKLTS